MHEKHDLVHDLELTDEASRGRLHPGSEANKVHHRRNLVHCYWKAHPRSPDGACPELLDEWREDEQFAKARSMLYPLPQL